MPCLGATQEAPISTLQTHQEHTSFVAKSTEKLNRYLVVEFDSNLCRPFMYPIGDGGINGSLFRQCLQDGFQIGLGFIGCAHIVIFGHGQGDSTGMFF